MLLDEKINDLQNLTQQKIKQQKKPATISSGLVSASKKKYRVKSICKGLLVIKTPAISEGG